MGRMGGIAGRGLAWLLLGLELAAGCKFVDLKNNYISDGVIVYHGSFMGYGKYKLFRGEGPGLEVVRYGDVKVFPGDDYVEGTHSLYVEFFHMGYQKYISIYVFIMREHMLYLVSRLYYVLENKGFKQVDFQRFSEMVKGTIHISVDITRAMRHPFVRVATETQESHKVVNFRIARTPEAVPLCPSEFKHYEFGRVYDSDVPMVVGMRKVESFVNRCTSFSVSSSNNVARVILRSGKNVVMYELRAHNGGVIWRAMTESAPTLVTEVQIRALEVMNKLLTLRIVDEVVLDVAENISPEIMGIEKVEGCVGAWKYTLYQIKDSSESGKKINLVVDTEVSEILICRVEPAAVVSYAEVFSNSAKSFIVVTSILQSEGGFLKGVKCYEKTNYNKFSYFEITLDIQPLVLAELHKACPIKLDIYIDGPPDILEWGEKHLGAKSFRYFRIRKSDMLGLLYKAKYTIGNVWMRDEVEEGNIEIDGWRTRYKIISHQLCEDRFLIAGMDVIEALEGSEYEDYPVIIM